MFLTPWLRSVRSRIVSSRRSRRRQSQLTEVSRSRTAIAASRASALSPRSESLEDRCLLTVTTITDTTLGTATVDGMVDGFEYVGSSTGLEDDFGDQIGATSVLSVDSSDSGTVSFALESGVTAIAGDNVAVIYIDDGVSNGVANTSVVNDTSGASEAAISGNGRTMGGTSDLTFASDFIGTHAITIESDFIGLFSISDSGTLSLIASSADPGSVNFSAAGVGTASPEWSFDGDALGGLAPGDSFNYFATLINETNAFRANEFQGVASAPATNIGAAAHSLAMGDFNTFNSISNEVDLSVDVSTGTETDQTVVTVTATTSIAVDGMESVDIAATGVTSEDFDLSDTSITIADGQTTGSVTFTILDDIQDDDAETATLTISNPSSGLVLGTTTTQSVMITDNDTATTAVYGTIAGGDDITVSVDTGNLEIHSGPTLIDSRAIAELTGGLTVNGQDSADDFLTVLLEGTQVVPAGGFTFNGGTGGNDALAAVNTAMDTDAAYTPDAATTGNGTVLLDVDGDEGTVTFTGLEPVDLIGFDTASLTLPGADDVLTVQEDGEGEGLIVVSGTSGGVAIESVAFADNVSVAIDTSAVDGNDTITINETNDPHGNDNLTISTGAGTDRIDVDGELSLEGEGEGELTLVSGMIDVGATGGLSAPNIFLIGDEIDLGGGTDSISGSGILAFLPVDPSANVTVGQTADTGAAVLDLTDADLGAIAAGFSEIGIGLEEGNTPAAGAVDIDSAVFNADVGIGGSSISVTGLDAGMNDVLLSADAGAITDGGTTETDITAGSVILLASGNVGAGTNFLDVDVDNLEGAAGSGGTGGFWVEGSSDLTVSDNLIGGVAATGNVSIWTGTVGPVAGLQVNGQIDSGGGNIDLQSSTDLGVLNSLDSRGGNVSLIADGNILLLGMNADITTDGGSLTISADDDGNGDMEGEGILFQEDPGSLLDTFDEGEGLSGSVSISALDVDLSGSIDAGSETVSFVQSVTGGTISLGSSSDFSLSDTEIDGVTAGAIAVGDATSGEVVVRENIDPANTNVLVIESGADIDAAGTSALIVDTLDLTAPGGIGETPANGQPVDVADLITDTTNEGEGPDGDQAIDHGSSLTALNLNAGSGSISLLIEGSVTDSDSTTDIAGDSLVVVANPTTSPGPGDFGTMTNFIDTDVNSLSVDLSSDDPTIDGGSMWISEADDLSAIDLNASSPGAGDRAGNIVLTAAGAITDLDPADDVIGVGQINGAASITAAGGIGSGMNFIGTQVGTLAADGGTSGVWIENSEVDLTIGTVGSTTGITANGTIAIYTGVPASTGTSLTVDDNVDSNGGAIDLQADESVIINAAVTSDNGNISIDADTEGEGASSGNDVTVSGTGSVSAGSGDIVISGADVDIDGTVTGSGTLTFSPSFSGTSIGIGDGSGSFELDSTEIGNLTDGFSEIRFEDLPLEGEGEGGGEGEGEGLSFAIVEDATFTDPVTITLESIIFEGTTGLSAVDGGTPQAVTLNQLEGGGIRTDAGAAPGDDVTGSTVTVDGSIEPGNTSPGELSVNASLSLSSGSTFVVNVNGTTAGADYDQITVQGAARTVSLNSAELIVVDGTFDAATDDTFTIIDNVDSGSAVTGTFAGLPEGATVVVNDLPFQISYVGGTDGNDVVLSFDSTPDVPAVDDGDEDDAFSIAIVGGNVQITQDGQIILDVPTGDLDSLEIDGGGGDDTLTLDFTGGMDPVPDGGLTFNGGGQMMGTAGDGITIMTDSEFTDQVFNFTNADANGKDGTIDVDGNIITFTGLEPINAGNSVNTVLNLPTGVVNDAILQNSTNAGEIEIIDNGATFEDTVIPNPTGSLTVNLGDQGDLLDVLALDTGFNVPLIINGGAGADDVDVTGATLDTNDLGRGLEVGTAGTVESLTITNSTITDNTATVGGGLLVTGGSVVIDNSMITDNVATGNTATEGGGGIYITGSASVTLQNGSTISGNLATGTSGSGGGVFVNTGGDFDVSSSTITMNSANRAGGGIEDNSGAGTTLTLTSLTLTNNDVDGGAGTAMPGNGGGLHVTGAGNVTIDGGTFTGNDAASEGGALWNGSGTLTINDDAGSVLIDNNTASGAASDEGGGGIFNAGGTVIINDNDMTNTVTISNNLADGAAGSGGGILSDAGGTLTVTGAVIDNNSANRAGGGIEDNSGNTTTVTLTNVSLTNNDVDGGAGTAAPGNGGGLHVTGAGNVLINGGTVTGNDAALEGGGLWNGSGTMTISDTAGSVLIDNNTASGAGSDEGGGGIFNAGGTVIIQDNGANTVTISNNLADGAAGSGGGILNDASGTLTVTGAVIDMNSANRAGGGIEDNSGNTTTVTLTNVSLTNNDVDGGAGTAAPGNGGGLHVTGAGDVLINGGTITGNDAALEGGGLWNGSGTMTIGDTAGSVLIDNNTASGAGSDEGGGGIFNAGGTIIIQDNGANTVTISNNLADGAAGSGGGILNDAGGTLTVTGAVIDNNSANRAGGGIEDNSGNTTTITLTTVSLTNNDVDGGAGTAAPGNGGGLHITGAGDSLINGGTITGNDAAAEGGGLWNGSGTMTISDTAGSVLIDNNTASGDNAAEGGGGIFNAGGTVIIQDNGANTVTISNNTADGMAASSGGNGGGILSDGGIVTATGAVISGNSANRAGGGIEANSAMVTLTDVTLGGSMMADGNTASVNGGGLHISGAANVTIQGGSVSNNVATQEGGGLWNSGSGTLTVESSGVGGTTIDSNTANGDDGPTAQGGGGIFNVGGTLSVTDATISNNVSTATMAGNGGGGVLIESGANNTFSNTTISGNTATATGTADGGGILIAGGATVAITGGTISGNAANRAGGGIELNASTLTLTTLTLTNVTLGGSMMADANTAGVNGGGLHMSGAGMVTIDGGTIQNNTAAQEGGGLWNGTGTMIITEASGNVLIDNNTASGADADQGGGGIFNAGGTVTINDTGANSVTISNNDADGASGSGGGILNDAGGTVTVTGASITGNSANRAGGGIEDNSGAGLGITLTSVTLNSNAADGGGNGPGNGGGLHVTGAGDVSITGGTVSNNTAALEGGGLWNGTGTLTVQNGTAISANTASGDAADDGGGGIFNNGGTLVVDGSTSAVSITNNIAGGTSGSGGGIFNNTGGTITVTSSSITGNRANRAGGGIEDTSGAGLGVTLTNVTLSGNNAGVSPAVAAPGNGGGLHVSGAGDVTIDGGTIQSNVAASEGGGLWNGTGTLTINDASGSVLISGNTASGSDATNGGGGIFNAGGAVSILDSGANTVTVSNNLASGTSGSGGGVFNDAGGSFTATGAAITGNSANRAGGGIETTDGTTVTLANVTLDGNDVDGGAGTAAPGNGGGLHMTNSATVIITGGTVSNNDAAAEGGGLWNGSGTMTIDGTAISGNTASGASSDQGGGGVFNAGGTVTIQNGAAITNNIADGASGSGGGILNDVNGNLIINGTASAVSITGNRANRAGGGIEDNSGATTTITLTSVNLDSNNAGVSPATASPGNGGGLHISGPGNANITGGTVNNNTAAAEGGGLWNGSGAMTVDGTTISGNSASGSGSDQGGGGLFNAGGVLTVQNASVTGNTANTPNGGGGGALSDGGTLNVSSSTISGSDVYGLLYVNSASGTVSGNTFSSNTGGDVAFAGTSGADTLTTTATTVSDGAGTVTFDTGVPTLSVLGLGGTDSFAIAPAASTQISVIGGDPTTSPGDSVTFNQPASGSSTLTISGADGGTIETSGSSDVVLSEIESLSIAGSNGSLTVNGSGEDDTFAASFTTGDAATVSVTTDADGNPGPAVTFNFDYSGIQTLTIDAQAGNDVLSLTDPQDGPTAGLTFAGGADSDSIVLVSGTAASVTHTFANASDGTIDVDSRVTTYTGLEPITDNLSVTDRVFTFSDVADNVTLADGTTGRLVLSSTGTSETVDYADASSSTTINLGDGGDVLDASGAGTAITVNGGAGADSVTGSSQDDLINGDAGNDTLAGGPGDDTVNGGDDDDTFTYTGGDGDDSIDGGAGDDTLNIIGSASTTTGDLFAVSESGGDLLINQSQGSPLITYGQRFNGIENLVIDANAGDDTVSVASLAGLTAPLTSLVVNLGDGNDSLDASAATTAVSGNGDAGNDLLTGGSVNDVLSGGDGADTIDGALGDDSIDGGAGNDDLSGSNGADTLNGGDGNDTLTGGLDDDTINGDADDDLILWNNGDGSDAIDAGTDPIPMGATENPDTDRLFVDGALTTFFEGEVVSISADAGGDLLVSRTAGANFGAFTLDVGGLESLRLRLGEGDDSADIADLSTLTQALDGIEIRLGDGDDTVTSAAAAPNTSVIGGDGFDNITTGDGDDFIDGDHDSDTIDGGLGNDRIFGGHGEDVLTGGGGDDNIFGQGGNDTIHGGAGADIIRGDAGGLVVTDEVSGTIRLRRNGFTGSRAGEQTRGRLTAVTLIGGSGDDIITVLRATRINVHFEGGDGNDTLAGARGNDTLLGGEGNDVLRGSAGADVLNGEGGNDTVRGQGGRDIVFGGAGNDRVEGGKSDDTIGGGSGNDRVVGLNGRDTVIGGAGVDTVDGGSGVDSVTAAGNGSTLETGDSVAGSTGEIDNALTFDFETIFANL